MRTPGFIATATLRDGSVAALVHLRCQTPQAAASAPLRELAGRLAHLLAENAPRYLRPADVPGPEAEAVLLRWRTEALRRGIPDGDLDDYAAQAARRELALRSLMGLPLDGGTVEEALRRLGEQIGERVDVARFHRMSLDD